MNGFEKFRTIPQADMDMAVGLSESFLSAGYDPQVIEDGSIVRVREFQGRLDNPDELILTRVWRIKSDTGTDRLVAAKVSERYDDGAVVSTLYTLVLSNGRFLVQRSTDNCKNIIPFEQRNFNAHAQKEADILEFELGLMNPDENDWDNFIDLLESPTRRPAEQTIAKVGRLARILGSLRKD